MYKTRDLHDQTCRFLLRYCGMYTEQCDMAANKHILKWPDWLSVENQCWLCGVLGFPIVYYIVLTIGVIGIMTSLKDLIKALFGRTNSLSTWPQRKFFLFTSQHLRKYRKVGSLLNLYSWVQLVLSLLLGKPYLMALWMLVHVSLLMFDATIWMFEVLFTSTEPDLYTLFNFILSFAKCAFVCYVRKVMDQAVVLDDLEGLNVWPFNNE